MKLHENQAILDALYALMVEAAAPKLPWTDKAA